jgi:hypothetical protein
MNAEETLKKVINSITSDVTEEEMINMKKKRIMDRKVIFKTFFSNYIENTEGSSCCVDKAGYIASEMDKALVLDKNIKLRETYRQYQAAGGNIGGIKELDNIAYWCPKSIEDTNEAIKIFYRYINMIGVELI